jgi:molecular chaperone HtpG
MSHQKKSLIVTNEKINNYLHDDIVFSILSKLPLKSLKRFGCVRKSWSLLFENTYFMNMVRSYCLSKDPSHRHDAFILLQQLFKPITLYSPLDERIENMAKLDFPNPFQEETETCFQFEILNMGGINDVICVRCHLRGNDLEKYTRVLLWNPTTDESKVIPRSPTKSQRVYVDVNVHGFGYDCVKHDYKVLQHIQFMHRSFPCTGYVSLGNITFEPFWEIYNLRSNSWRKLDVVMPTFYHTPHARVYMDGVCHWLSIDFESYLVSFDLSNESFFTTAIPSDIDCGFDEGYLWRHLMVLNESIALVTYHEEKTTFNISILGELNVKESWIKLFIVGFLPSIEYPIGVAKGKLFFKRIDKELAWIDLTTHMIEDFGAKEGDCSFNMLVYKENFLPIDRCNK